MAIEITGRHVSITESMRDYALKKMQNAIGGAPQVENVHIILDVQKYRQIAEIVLQGKNHLRLEAREMSEDMYASIDRVMDKIERQLHKSKDKKIDKRGRPRVQDVEKAIGDETTDERK